MTWGLVITHDNPENRSEEHGSESAPEGVGDEGSNNRREAGHARIDVVHVCCSIWLHVVAAHQVTREGRREGAGRHSSCREETFIASDVRARTGITRLKAMGEMRLIHLVIVSVSL